MFLGQPKVNHVLRSPFHCRPWTVIAAVVPAAVLRHPAVFRRLAAARGAGDQKACLAQADPSLKEGCPHGYLSVASSGALAPNKTNFFKAQSDTSIRRVGQLL